VPSAELRVGESRIRRRRARAARAKEAPVPKRERAQGSSFYARRCGPLHRLFPFHPMLSRYAKRRMSARTNHGHSGWQSEYPSPTTREGTCLEVRGSLNPRHPGRCSPQNHRSAHRGGGLCPKFRISGAIYVQGEAEEEAAVAMFGPTDFFGELWWGKSTTPQFIASGDLLRDRGASFRKLNLTRIDNVSRIEQYSQVVARTLRSP
jgi:hypothetical protein